MKMSANQKGTLSNTGATGKSGTTTTTSSSVAPSPNLSHNAWHNKSYKLSAKIQASMGTKNRGANTGHVQTSGGTNNLYKKVPPHQHQHQHQQHKNTKHSNQWLSNNGTSKNGIREKKNENVSTHQHIHHHQQQQQQHNNSKHKMLKHKGLSTNGTMNNTSRKIDNKIDQHHHHHKNNIHIHSKNYQKKRNHLSHFNNNKQKQSFQSFSTPTLTPRLFKEEDMEQNNHLSNNLHSTLSSHGLFEDSLGRQKRIKVLNELEELLRNWVDKTLDGSSQKDSSTSHCGSANRATARLIPFGSYRLNVHSSKSDLDVLVLCPSNITRTHFFTTLVDDLKVDKRIKALHPIPGAYTPVITFYMNDISIDLLFARLIHDEKLCMINNSDVNGSRIEKQEENEQINHHNDQNHQNQKRAIEITTKCNNNNISIDKSKSQKEGKRDEFELDDSMLIGLDEASVRSLNGVRVAQFLLEYIPNKTNFCTVLRTVKRWAYVHGLYSNVLGFLGGINWAILVAWVCKQNMNASPPFLLKIFFQTFPRWRWSSYTPVQLSPAVKNPPKGVFPLTIWDPAVNPRDRAHIMPILTPCYPCMNSSYNVGKSQLRRLREELFNGDQIMNQIIEGKMEWADLLKGNDLFTQHTYYIQVSISSTNAKDHRLWFGFCESRLRILIAGLESHEHGSLAYPFARFFTRKEMYPGAASDSNDIDTKKSLAKIVTSFYIALRFEENIRSVDLKSCMEEYTYMVNNFEGRKMGMDLNIKHVLQEDLPNYVFEDNEDVDLEKLVEAERSVNEDSKREQQSLISRNPESQSNDFANQSLQSLASPMKKAKISSSMF